MIKIKLISPVIVRGHDGAAVGSVLEVDQWLAHELTSMGAAVPVVSDEVQVREPVIENRDPITLGKPPEKPSRQRRAK